jgi:hypothetical protein
VLERNRAEGSKRGEVTGRRFPSARGLVPITKASLVDFARDRQTSSVSLLMVSTRQTSFFPFPSRSSESTTSWTRLGEVRSETWVQPRARR